MRGKGSDRERRGRIVAPEHDGHRPRGEHRANGIGRPGRAGPQIVRIGLHVAAVDERQEAVGRERSAEVEVIMAEHSTKSSRALADGARRIRHAGAEIRGRIGDTVRNTDDGEARFDRPDGDDWCGKESGGRLRRHGVPELQYYCAD
jgi:hypothetical protein